MFRPKNARYYGIHSKRYLGGHLMEHEKYIDRETIEVKDVIKDTADVDCEKES